MAVLCQKISLYPGWDLNSGPSDLKDSALTTSFELWYWASQLFISDHVSIVKFKSLCLCVCCLCFNS